MNVVMVDLNGVAETMLFTLYCRARDSRTRQPVLGDPYAAAVHDRVRHGLPLVLRTAALDRYIVALRAKRIDDWTREFLSANPTAVVLQLACGLDSRVLRVDPPATVDWFDLDLPEVIDLRNRLCPSVGGHHRTIAASATDSDWLTELPIGRPTLVIAEGLLMYLPKSQVKSLLNRITSHFGHGSLIFDVVSGWFSRVSMISPYKLRWGIEDPHEIEKWNPHLALMDDAPVFSDYERVPRSGFRIPYQAMSRLAATRNAFRPLRYTFETIKDDSA